MVSEPGPLSRALWGAVIAVVMLKLGLVDCERWDLFALRARLKVLREIPDDSLPPELGRAREKLLRAAQRASKEGPIEVESDE